MAQRARSVRSAPPDSTSSVGTGVANKRPQVPLGWFAKETTGAVKSVVNNACAAGQPKPHALSRQIAKVQCSDTDGDGSESEQFKTRLNGQRQHQTPMVFSTVERPYQKRRQKWS